MNWLCKDCRAPFATYAACALHVRETHDRAPRTPAVAEAMAQLHNLEGLLRKVSRQ